MLDRIGSPIHMSASIAGRTICRRNHSEILANAEDQTERIGSEKGLAFRGLKRNALDTDETRIIAKR